MPVAATDAAGLGVPVLEFLESSALQVLRLLVVDLEQQDQMIVKVPRVEEVVPWQLLLWLVVDVPLEELMVPMLLLWL